MAEEIQKQAQQPAQAGVQPEAGGKKKWLKWLIIIIVVLVIAGGAYWLFLR